MRGGGLVRLAARLSRSRRRASAPPRAGEPARERITLVAEMEHPDGVTPTVMARLRSYERAGFRKIDPDTVRYMQPDFRPPADDRRSVVRPVPLALVVRRVGREAGSDRRRRRGARAGRRALHHVRRAHARRHMAPLWALLDHFPGPGETVLLRNAASDVRRACQVSGCPAMRRGVRFRVSGVSSEIFADTRHLTPDTFAAVHPIRELTGQPVLTPDT